MHRNYKFKYKKQDERVQIKMQYIKSARAQVQIKRESKSSTAIDDEIVPKIDTLYIVHV